MLKYIATSTVIYGRLAINHCQKGIMYREQVHLGVAIHSRTTEGTTLSRWTL